MKHNYIYILLISIIFCYVYIYAFDSKLDLNGDNANYLVLAENLSKGLGYNQVTPDGLKPHTHFPIGYPAFLSFFMLFGIKSLVFFKVLNGLLFFGSLIILFYLTKKLTQNTPLAFTGVVLPVFSPQLLHFSNIVMSEMLFMFLSILCLFFLYQYTRSGKSCFFKSPWIYAAIISAAASYYVRAVGLATIFAVIVFFLFRKEWKQALFSLGGSFVLLLPWVLRNKHVTSGSRYMDAILSVNHWRPEEGSISTFGDFINKLFKNFDEAIIKGFKEVLFPFINIDYNTSSNAWEVLTGLLILGLVFYGAWKFREIKWALIALLLGNIGMVIIGTGGNGSRYIIPVTPIIYICFYSGIYYILSDLVFKKTTRVIRNLPYLFILLIFAMWPSVKIQAENAKSPVPPAYKNYFTIAKEMQKQLPENTVCACRKPELFRYYAPQIYPVRYMFSTQPEEVIIDMINKNVDFVILEQLGYSSTYLYLYPTIQKYPELFPVVWHLENPDTYLLKFERKKAESKLNETNHID